MVVILLLIFFPLCSLNRGERDWVEGGVWAAADGEIIGLLGSAGPLYSFPPSYLISRIGV